MPALMRRTLIDGMAYANHFGWLSRTDGNEAQTKSNLPLFGSTT
jgi:hypothetical protein